jgi:hypothetical protein
MKLRAARGRRDLEDIAVLVGACGLTSVDEAKAIFEAFFPEHDLSVRALGALEAALETP